MDEFANDSRVRIDAIPACEAKGLGWARSRAQLLYDGEEFNLQIDGHTRFIEGWDEVLIGMLAQIDSPKGTNTLKDTKAFSVPVVYSIYMIIYTMYISKSPVYLVYTQSHLSYYS